MKRQSAPFIQSFDRISAGGSMRGVIQPATPRRN